MGKVLESRLSALKDLCNRQRQGSSRPPRYSAETKELVRSLSGAGAEVAALAQAAGVSGSAIRTWLSDRATCNACGLAYHDFLREVMIADENAVKAHPEQYFPHVIAARVRDPPSEPDATQPAI